MNRLRPAMAALYLAPLFAGEPPGAPVQNEVLAYSINWPSGLSLGEARLISHQANSKWFFELVLDAGVPGFAVSDHFRSASSLDLCAVEFERETLHGKRKTHEKTTFDAKLNLAHRVTLDGGGKSDLKIGTCARDALAFIAFVRRELGQGRVPPPQPVFYGSQYQVKIDYTGTQNITHNDKKAKADRVLVGLKGPKTDLTFEIFFGLDAARTPLAIKLPLSVGAVSVELAP